MRQSSILHIREAGKSNQTSQSALQTLYYDSNGVARMAVAAFRADVARAGAMAEVATMVDELSRSTPAFKAMWQDNDSASKPLSSE